MWSLWSMQLISIASGEEIRLINMVVEKLLAQDYNWAIMLPKGDE